MFLPHPLDISLLKPMDRSFTKDVKALRGADLSMTVVVMKVCLKAHKSQSQKRTQIDNQATDHFTICIPQGGAEGVNF